MALYLMFNEGYVATRADGLFRADVCREAIRLAALVAELLPTVPAPTSTSAALCAEAKGLAALMTFHDARREARTDDDGALVPLEEQDRARWDHRRIASARALLDEAWQMRLPGPYQLQAAIAALHCEAPRAEDTDWAQVAALYGVLVQQQSTAIVRLNAAVAAAFALGSSAASPPSTRSTSRASSPATTCSRRHAPTCCAAAVASTKPSSPTTPPSPSSPTPPSVPICSAAGRPARAGSPGEESEEAAQRSPPDHRASSAARPAANSAWRSM